MSKSPPLSHGPNLADDFVFSEDLSTPIATHFSLIPIYSWESPYLKSDSVQMVPKTLFTVAESKSQVVSLSDSEMLDLSDATTAEGGCLQICDSTVDLEIHDLGAEREMPPFIPNVYASEEARIQYLQYLGMFFPSVLSLIKSGH